MFAEKLHSLGGIGQSTLGTARLLHTEFGRTIDLIFGEEGDLSEAWAVVCRRKLQVGTLLLRWRDPKQLLHKVLRSIAFASRAKPDVVYCQSMHQLPLGRAVSIALKRPLVLHLRTAPPRPNRRNVRRLHGVSRAISVSPSTADEWVSAFPWLAGQTAVIPNGIDLTRFYPVTNDEKTARRIEIALPSDAFVIAYVGRFSPEKGPLDLVQAFMALGVGSDVQLVLVGDVDQRAPEYGMRLKNSRARNIRFIPPTPSVDRVIQAADLVVVPSHAEAFGRVVVESLACGVPVFGTRVGGIAEILRDTPELLFSAGNIPELSSKIADAIVAGRHDTEQFSPGALRAAALGYGEVSVAERVDAVLAEVAHGLGDR